MRDERKIDFHFAPGIYMMVQDFESALEGKFMNRYAIYMLLLPAFLMIAGCPVPETPPTPEKPWYWADPVTKTPCYLYVPEKYHHDKPMKVIVSCHGTPPFDVAEHHIRTWKYYGEKYGCIIICPSMQGTDGVLGDGPVLAMMENERNILSILSTLSYQYNIDRNNIMITGFSGGGFPAYWVGLRHPEIFSVIVPQNCNFNRNNVDGWYPADARNIPIKVYYGEFDPAPIIVQSENAIQYLREKNFKVNTEIIPGAGHDRHPEIAMDFFRKHWRTPAGTSNQITANGNRNTPVRIKSSGNPDNTDRLGGPRPPTY